eukprot:363908-Rhodomonas_salina.1
MAEAGAGTTHTHTKTLPSIPPTNQHQTSEHRLPSSSMKPLFTLAYASHFHTDRNLKLLSPTCGRGLTLIPAPPRPPALRWPPRRCSGHSYASR